jgi:transposase
MDLRERIVKFVSDGGTKAEAARRFKVSRWTVYRYHDAAQNGGLAPKPCGGSAKRFDDDALRREVKDKPSATLKAHGKALGVSHNAVWKRLRQLAITLKKNNALRRTGRGAEVALPQGARAPRRPAGVFPGRVRR